MKKILLSGLLLSTILFGEDKILTPQKATYTNKEFKENLFQFEKTSPETFIIIKDFFNSKYCTKNDEFKKYINKKELEEFGASEQFGFLMGLKFSSTDLPYMYENIMNNYRYLNCFETKENKFKIDVIK